MKMPVRIDVIERQPGRPVRLELRADFPCDLPPHGSIHGDLGAIAGKIIAELTAAVDETRNLRTVGDRIAIDEDDVKPDAQARQRPRARDRIGRRGSADHETRGAQDAASMRLFDRGVDGLAEPEIVRSDDQVVQCASSRRSRRKAKNSAPSRSRRIIICGLRTISETIAAILGVRK
jgi:hypothetical protein